MHADLALVNGTIYTLNNRQVEAVAVAGEKIIGTGSTIQIKNLIRNSTEVIDLKGKTVIPGFNDSHIHLMAYGFSLKAVDLSDVTSPGELIEVCREFIAERGLKQGEWLLGRGWNQNNFCNYDRFPDREILDKISRKHPILLLRVCGHIGAVNTRALKTVGIEKPPEIEGGVFARDKNGTVNGVIKESALEWFKKHMQSQRDVVDLKRVIREASGELVKYGLTSVQTEDSYDLGYAGDFKNIYRAYNELVINKELPLRVYQKISLPRPEDLKDFLATGLRTGDGSNYYRIGPLKLWLDGTLGARTAGLLEEYEDDPGNKGIMVYSDRELLEMVQLAHREGLQVCLHAIGDAALKQALTVLERVLSGRPYRARHRIVHCQIGDNNLYRKIADLGIVVNIQPVFVASDWNMVRPRLGPAREKESYSWNKLLELGVKLSAGTDCPVESPNPFYGLYSAIMRKDMKGKPPGGWLPAQKLSLKEALEIYTTGSAYASFEEGIKGTIEEDKLADLAVLPRDPFQIKPDELKELEVEMTIVGGKIRWVR